MKKILTLETVSFALLLLAGVSTGQAAPKLVYEIKVDATVSAGGEGKYASLQAAIDAAPDNGTNPFVIFLKAGTYDRQIIVPKGKDHVRLIGENVTNTLVTYGLNVNESNVFTITGYKGIGFIILGDDFSAEHITFQNTSGDHGQALALRADGDRGVFNDCRMLGWQDTVRADDGRDYFTNCYIEGRVDFIYGSAAVVFNHCEIHSKNGGHVTAANTPQSKPYGFVFLNCKLTGDPQAWVAPGETVGTNVVAAPMADLGRPWRPYASVAYLNCEMGTHINPVGWNNWRNPSNELTARYAEYNSTGPGANPDKRVKWAKQLTKEEADKITVKSVLSGSDGWDPTKQPKSGWE